MSDYEKLIGQLRRLATEQANPDTIDIDRLSAEEIVGKIHTEDRKIADIVGQALPRIAEAATVFADTLRNNHRVFYIGAGTSGRLGVLDAAECPPTFGTEPEQVTGVIAGGYATMVLSMEGVEDRREAAVTDLKNSRFGSSDFLIGLAASRRTPYTLAGLQYAHSMNAKTAFIICNTSEGLEFTPDILIELPVGPEVITGSTRMKSGTAQKMALNMISTTAMVLLGKTYGNLMIDLQARSEKLAARSRKILMDLFDLDLSHASSLLTHAGGSVKHAIVMHALHCDLPQAKEKLEQVDGFIYRLLGDDD